MEWNDPTVQTPNWCSYAKMNVTHGWNLDKYAFDIYRPSSYFCLTTATWWSNIYGINGTGSIIMLYTKLMT